MNWMDIRIGQGYDVHALVEGCKLILGGVEILYTRGLFGRSDVDALLYTITDALFGTAGSGDIGRHFPDTDPVFAGADSHMLPREVMRRAHKAGYVIDNVDATVIAQEPRLAPHVLGMMANLTENFDIASKWCNVRAKINEKLGLEGKEEGITVQVMVLIYRTEGADQD